MATTVRITVSGPERAKITRGVLICRVADVVGGDVIRSVWRIEPGYIWFATLNSEQAADRLVEEKSLVENGLIIGFAPCNRRRIQVRVHWLPLWISDDEVKDFFLQYGKVDRVFEERLYHARLKKDIGTGVRNFSILVKEGVQDEIPYRTKICGRTCLITIRGRPVLCLKCGQCGHFRAECPIGRSATYAMAARSSEPVVPPSDSTSERPAARVEEPVQTDVQPQQQQVTAEVHLEGNRDDEPSLDEVPSPTGKGDDPSHDEVPPQPIQDEVMSSGDDPSDNSGEVPPATQKGDDPPHGEVPPPKKLRAGVDNPLPSQQSMDDELSLSGDDSDSDIEIQECDSVNIVSSDNTSGSKVKKRLQRRRNKKKKNKLNAISKLCDGNLSKSNMLSLLSPRSQAEDPAVVAFEKS